MHANSNQDKMSSTDKGKGKGKSKGKKSEEDRIEEKEQREWRETSTAAGLGGLTLSEAVKGALFSPLLQNMPDPLDAVSLNGHLM